MRYTIRRSEVYVLGRIWQPGAGLCSYTYQIPAGAGIITRARVQAWLDSNAGDFERIEDFSASIEHGKKTVDIPWSLPESEKLFLECAS
jgi:hypothetical protein